MVIYSHSRLSTFEQCPLKFKFRYIDKIRPEIEQSIEGFLGNKVHEVLEWVYSEVAKRREFNLDELIKDYVQRWNKDFNKDIKIVKKQYNAEHYLNLGVKFLVDYFTAHSPFKDNTIATEKRILIDLDNTGKYKLQGYVDRIVHNKETNIFEVHDYKTGNFMKSQEELDKDRQLALYAIGIRDMFEEVNDVHLIWHFLAHNKKIISKRTLEQLENLKQETIKLIDKIESTREFPKTPCALCGWCEFKQYCDNYVEESEDTKNKKDEESKKDEKNKEGYIDLTKNSKWNLYEDEKQLEPLVFSNGKSQQDIVNEVLQAIGQGNKIIFIKGMCGTGKSAIALNLAKEIGKTSIVVPIKSLQEQYSKDYSGKKYVLIKGRKMKISSIIGRKNFKCKFLQESNQGIDLRDYYTEKDAKLSDIFLGMNKPKINEKDDTCDNFLLPCKIEIKEKNLQVIKDYIKQNPDVKISNFSSVNEIRRMSVAPVCPYWAPIVPEEFEIKKFKDARKIKYKGLNNKNFTVYQRRKGCPYYDQYEAYEDADVIIFNSMKYKLETLMDRKPFTELEIIDECDDFLDSFANQEQISLNRLAFALSSIFAGSDKSQEILDKLTDITATLKRKYPNTTEEPKEIENTLIEELLSLVLTNKELLEEIEVDESNYIYHLDEVARMFHDFLEETFFSIEKRDNEIIIHLVTTNLAKKFNELVEKNKVFVMMSGTIHSENVLKNIFGLENFKIIDAETKHQGELIKCKHGYEMNCSYSSMNSYQDSREKYLEALSKTISSAKTPTLIHVNAFSDLPTEQEKIKFRINNLPTKFELIQEQKNDPFGQRIKDFKKGITNILFTTKCNRGVDFPGEICNSIVVTRFPYPNISNIFWKILKKTNPQHFMSFYMDKARRELLQKIYRGLRSKDDKVYLLSPDLRVLEF